MTPTKALITDFTKFFSIQPVDDAQESAKLTLETVHNIKQLQHPRYGLSICYKDKDNHYHQMMAIFNINSAIHTNHKLKQWFDENSPTGIALTDNEFYLVLREAVILPF